MKPSDHKSSDLVFSAHSKTFQLKGSYSPFPAVINCPDFIYGFGNIGMMTNPYSTICAL